MTAIPPRGILRPARADLVLAPRKGMPDWVTIQQPPGDGSPRIPVDDYFSPTLKADIERKMREQELSGSLATGLVIPMSLYRKAIDLTVAKLRITHAFVPTLCGLGVKGQSEERGVTIFTVPAVKG